MGTQRNTVSKQTTSMWDEGRRGKQKRKRKEKHILQEDHPLTTWKETDLSYYFLLSYALINPGGPSSSFAYVSGTLNSSQIDTAFLFLFLYFWLLRHVISIQRLWLSVYTEAVSGVAFLAVFPKNGEDTGSIPVSCLCQRHWRTKYSSQAGTAILP